MSTATTAIPRFISVRVIARMLGRERHWVQRLCVAGTWPGTVKVGNTWRVPEKEVVAWLKRLPVPKP